MAYFRCDGPDWQEIGCGRSGESNTNFTFVDCGHNVGNASRIATASSRPGSVSIVTLQFMPERRNSTRPAAFSRLALRPCAGPRKRWLHRGLGPPVPPQNPAFRYSMLE